jgi:HEAT repeat protein
MMDPGENDKLIDALQDPDILVRLAAAHELKGSLEPLVIDALFDAFPKPYEHDVHWWNYEDKYSVEYEFLTLLLELPTACATARLRNLLTALPESDYNGKIRICEGLANRNFESDLEASIEAGLTEHGVADSQLLHALARTIQFGDRSLRIKALSLCKEANCQPTAIIIALAYVNVLESEFQPVAEAFESRLPQISNRLLAMVSYKVFSEGSETTKRKLHLSTLLLLESCERHPSTMDWDHNVHSFALSLIKRLSREGDCEVESIIEHLVRVLSFRDCANCQEVLESILEIGSENGNLTWSLITHLLEADFDQHEFIITRFIENRGEQLLETMGWYQHIEEGDWAAASKISSIVKQTTENEIATWLRSWVDSEKSSLRIGGIRYMGLFSNRAEEILDSALLLLDDEDHQVQCEAAECLGRLKDLTALPILIQKLGDRTPSGQFASAIAICQICSPATLGMIHLFIVCPKRFHGEWSKTEEADLRIMVDQIRTNSEPAELRAATCDLVRGQKFRHFLNSGFKDCGLG